MGHGGVEACWVSGSGGCMVVSGLGWGLCLSVTLSHSIAFCLSVCLSVVLNQSMNQSIEYGSVCIAGGCLRPRPRNDPLHTIKSLEWK